MNLIILVTFGCLFYNVLSEIKTFCSESFCKSYIAKNNCNAIPDACQVQNVTHNGVFLPFPGPCNCCDYCLENLDEAASCAKGDPTSPPPTAICGPSLACALSTSGSATCQKMVTPCIQKQNDYDKRKKEGNMGHLELRPVCDRNGMFASFACVPQEICYCVSKDGRRLFGDIPYTNHPEYILKCKCSRRYDDVYQNGYGNLYLTNLLRCQSQGDFDSLQCIGDSCLCTDTDGNPTYSSNAVNIRNISETLPCFDPKIHRKGAYFQKCESEYIERVEIINNYKMEGYDVMSYNLPNCQLDGFYAPVQEKDNIKYCSNPLGKMLEDFEVLISNSSSLDMNCKCARTRSLIESDEKPECCKNGNYKPMQCRRGLCRCVDENGMQVEKEVEFLNREELSCFKKLC